MPWRIVDYTSANENMEEQLVLNRASNTTYRSFNRVLIMANEMLQRYSGEFIIPEEFKFKKEEKASLLEVGYINRGFQIPGTEVQCKIYIVHVQPYKAPIPPIEERRRSERERPAVNYAEDNFNYERWEHRLDRLEDDEDEDEEVVFVEEVIPQDFIQQFNNLQIRQQPAHVPRFLLGEF